MRRPLLVCPLEFEARVVRSRCADLADVRVSGPGAEAVSALISSLETAPPRALLVGLAGGLTLDAPGAHAAHDVINADSGESMRATMHANEAGARLVSVMRVVGAPEEKIALRQRHEADLVDLEGFAFARACTERGIEWAIIRGVSDGPGDAMPRRVERWTDARGRARPLRVALDLLQSPGDIGRTLGLTRRSRRAMVAAAALTRRVLDAHVASPTLTPDARQRP